MAMQRKHAEATIGLLLSDTSLSDKFATATFALG